MDIQIGIAFDDKPGLCFNQGEDRSIIMTLYDAEFKTPVNLSVSGTVVGLNLPLQGGGSIKRTSGPVTAQCANVTTTPMNSVLLTDHGFVTGDPVQVAAVGGGTLPGGLAPSTPYLVEVLDLNTFSFTDTSANVIALTSKGVGAFSITNANDVQIITGDLGQVQLNLRSLVTAAVNPAYSQNFQVEYVISGKTRIAILHALLDVDNQPVQ